MVKLSPEQRLALSSNSGKPICVEDEQTEKVYVLVEDSLHALAMQALERENREAIRMGIEDMEAGRVVAFSEVDARIRKSLGLPPREL